MNLLIWTLIFLGLYLASLYSYPLFHSLVEIFSIVIACGIFVIAWNSRQFIDNHYLLFIGIAYLFIGFLDLIHTLAYKGMGVFIGFDANLPTQLWIASRYLQAISLFMAPWFLKTRLRIGEVLAGYTLVTFFLLVSIFYLKIFPDCFIEGVGLTPFKKISEYIISLILLGSIYLLLKNRGKFDKTVLQWVVWSIIFTVASELAFTFYIHVYGFSNLVGHYLKVLSFYFIYKALIETGLARPYDLLFRNLKQSEERLRESEGRLLSIIETASDAIITIDAHGRVNLWNPSAERMFGYSSQEMAGQLLTRIMPERFRQPHQTAMERAVSTGQSTLVGKTIEMEGLRRDGREFHLELSIERWETKEGIFFTGIIRDITRRKRVLKELQEAHHELEKRVEERTAELVRANELLERVFSSIDLLIAHMDRDFNFLRVNKAYAEAEEQTPEYFVGKNHFALFPNRENEAIFKRVVETGEPVFFYGKPFVHRKHLEKRGTSWDWSLQPVKETDGRVSGLVLSLINVTERKEMESRIQAMNALLSLFYKKTSGKEYLESAVELLRNWSQCRCIGIRITNEQQYIPYESYIGFSEEFWKSESWLCLNSDQCVCTRVIQGTLDPRDASVTTSFGSFYSNNTATLVSSCREEPSRFRGVCVQSGFISVAVVPIRYKEEIIGAIHLADEKEEMVPLKTVEFIETLAPIIGEAVHRFTLESELHRNYETQKAINSLLRLSLENLPFEEFLEGTLDMIISNPMVSPWARGCIFLTESHNEVLDMKAQYGLPDSIQKTCARVPFGMCLCGRMALTKKIQYTDYPNDRHEFSHEDMAPHSHYHVPILYGNRLLGMITLYLKEGDRPTREKEAFLTAVANTLASIILRREWEEALRESESRLRLLSSQLLTVQENERKQIARDLHDGVGQMLSAIKFKIEDIIQQRDERKERIEDKTLGHLVPMIRESIEEVRRIQMNLRPSVLDDLGIIATISWLTREFEKVYSAISIQKQIDIQEDEIPVRLKTVIYRILQEALNNIAKHSRANRVTIALRKMEERIELTVEDNGTGFDLENRPRGFGLGSMRERVELSGGLFTIDSTIGKGTTIIASWTT